MSFRTGQRVQVADRAHVGHHRTPGYVRARSASWNASTRRSRTRRHAYGADGLPLRPLYLVGFAAARLWADYRGRADDTLRLDLFEHWLENAE